MLSKKITFTLFVIIFSTIIINSFANAATFTERATKHPAFPGKCFDKITRRPMIPYKEYKPKGICAVMTCDIDTYTINIETCPSVEVPGCEEIENGSLKPYYSYPKCCPQYLCKDEKTGDEFILDSTEF